MTTPEQYEPPRLDKVGSLQEITKQGSAQNRDTPKGSPNSAPNTAYSD